MLMLKWTPAGVGVFCSTHDGLFDVVSTLKRPVEQLILPCNREDRDPMTEVRWHAAD